MNMNIVKNTKNHESKSKIGKKIRPHTPEQNMAKSIRQKGKPLSIEHRNAISLGWKKKRLQETDGQR